MTYSNIITETGPHTPSLPSLRILSIVEDTMVDGPGFRTAVYCAGCAHACAGCHNPQSWPMDGGEEMSIDHIMRIIEADPYANVTFTGGDPMYQAEAFALLAQAIRRRTDKTIWCYTGFTLETLLLHPTQRRLLSLVDVLVDGPYIERLRNTDLRFRGSSNQRILDARQSLQQQRAVWVEAYHTS